MKTKTKKKIKWIFFLLFLFGNFIFYNHAYRFTHFVENESQKTQQPEKLSIGEKLKTILLGINIPKPKNTELPTTAFQTITLNSYEQLEAWKITVSNEKGIVILFHGYSSSKSGLLPYAKAFNQKGYSTLLVDFMGCGNSAGNLTTIGYKESRDVKAAFDFVKKESPNSQIILFGSSMGAVSIMKAIEDYDLKADKIILECPFGTMLATTKIRFKAMNLPAFPSAQMLLFYGSLQMGFNAFQHKPIEYAKTIKIPTLLFYGAKDKRVNRKEIDNIYQSLAGEKALMVLENSEHEVYLNDDAMAWNEAIDSFL